MLCLPKQIHYWNTLLWSIKAILFCLFEATRKQHMCQKLWKYKICNKLLLLSGMVAVWVDIYETLIKSKYKSKAVIKYSTIFRNQKLVDKPGIPTIRPLPLMPSILPLFIGEIWLLLCEMFECALELYLVSNGCPADSWDSADSDHFPERYFTISFRYIARILWTLFLLKIPWILGFFDLLSHGNYFLSFFAGK